MNYVELVEPRLGTDKGRWSAFSSACRPFGMVNLSPDSITDGDWGGGYRYSSKVVRGMSHIHSWQVSGILVMPITGSVDIDAGPDAWLSPFSHQDEICKPGDHRLTLDRYGIRTELTATCRVGLHRYHFPQAVDDPRIVLDLKSTLGPCAMADPVLRQISPTTCEGQVTNLPTVRKPKPLTIYFAVECGQPVKLDPFDPVRGRTLLRPTDATGPLELRIAISYTSLSAAWDNLHHETDHRTFDEIRTDARSQWNDWLSRIKVEGGTPEQRGRFYTSLFFALCGRRIVSDAAGSYIDNTGANPVVRHIPLDDHGQPRYHHHNSDAFWGAQWSITPLWALAYPQLIHDFCHCFFDMYRNGGLIPRGPAAGNYTFVMTSAQSTPLFATGLHTGIYRPDDIQAVYQALRKNHFPGGLMSKCGYEHNTCVGGGVEDYLERGYIPEDLPKAGYHANGAGQTIEHAFNDHALAQLAQTLGHIDDHAAFTSRARNWRNLFDRSIGFVRPRLRDGSWLEPYSPWNRKGWTECNAYTMTFYPIHDIAGLVECFGSRDALLSALENALEITRQRGYFVPHDHHQDIPIDFGNEPALYACHLFQAAGDPRRTQLWLNRVLDEFKHGNQPTDHFGGDEDEGLMGAWNVLATLGLFAPDGAVTRSPRYQLTTPQFDHIVIQLDDRFFAGRSLTITTYHRTPGALNLIQKAVLNRQPLPEREITHAQLVQGGHLELHLEPG